jgi:imidazole glycerol-phosphate synthase subunit HisF
MLQTRVIPCLQLIDESLVKTVRFGKYGYIGDPVNTVRIFNELEVDELAFVDIRATKENRSPNFEVLHHIADECFMPLSYGGGIRDFETARKVFECGFEKIILNTSTAERPELVTELARVYGSQAVVAAVDVKKNLWGKYEVYTRSGTVNLKRIPVEWIKEMEALGAGEILITSIDKEGTWKGFDLDLIKQVTAATSLPVIAHGGAGSVSDIGKAVKDGKASAVALGSMVVYQAQGLGVLVNFPDKSELEKALSE